MGKTAIIIPARMESTRFPGKPMAKADGRPLVHWTYDRAKQTIADHVIVATPDREIARYCDMNGLIWRPTREDHPTGTHRCAEVFEQIKADVGLVLNWQVNEPLVEPEDVNRLIESEYITGTLVANPLVGKEACGYHKTNTVKTVMSPINMRCYWFSRAPMAGAYFHCGVYAFLPNVLRALGKQTPSKHSLAESLEQLTWIDHGYAIYGVQIKGKFPLSINTPEDFAEFREVVE